MGALVQTKSSRIASLRAIESHFKPIEALSKSPVRLIGAVFAHEPHAFPEATTSPTLLVRGAYWTLVQLRDVTRL